MFGNLQKKQQLQFSELIKSNDTKGRLYKGLSSTQDEQYQRDQEKFEKMRQKKIQIVDYRQKISAEENQQCIKENIKQQIDIQIEIKTQQQKELNKQQQKEDEHAHDFFNKINGSQDIDRNSRQQLNKIVQLENQILSEHKKISKIQDKQIQNSNNKDSFINYDKRNQYLF